MHLSNRVSPASSLAFVLLAALLAVGTLSAPQSLAQSQSAAQSGAQQAPPPRLVGSLEIDKITPAPVQVIRGVTLAATPGEVFDFVTDHQEWPGFFSAIESVKVAGDGRRGSERSFTLAGGGSLSERIVAFDEPGADGLGTFAYSIEPENPFGVQGHLAVIELRPADGGGTALLYHQFFNHPDLAAIAPVVAGGTDEILSNILYRFGGELRSASHSVASQGAASVVIEQRRVIDASSGRAWTVLGEQWDAVDQWASVVSHSTVADQRGASFDGATRSCVVPGTPGFKETMIAYDEDALSLAYQVLEGVPPFVTRATNTWNIHPLSDRRVVVTSRVDLALAPGTPSPAVGMVKGQFTQILDITLDEFVQFVETGKPHPRKLAAQRAAKQG
ncbi:MAG: SRPBCC family protein [Acidobacteriota bacterium]